MKYFKILTILLASSTLLLSSCKDKAEATETAAPESELQPLQVFDAQNQQNKTTTAQNTSGVYHYTCNNGCAGGAAAAGNCATCGNALAHNQAYHANNNTTNTPATSQTNTPTTTPTPEPSQNTAGVWHYTCSQGCAGGAGSAVNCSSCGNKLAHNSAYH